MLPWSEENGFQVAAAVDFDEDAVFMEDKDGNVYCYDDEGDAPEDFSVIDADGAVERLVENWIEEGGTADSFMAESYGVAYLDGWVVRLNGSGDLSNVRGIARGALRGIYCGKLILPSCMTSIDSHMFENSSFNEVIIPDSVTNIAGGAFVNCEINERLTIGAGVTCIDLSELYLNEIIVILHRWRTLDVTSQEIKEAPQAWLSYALDSDTLIAEPPKQEDVKIDEFEPEPSAAGDFNLSIAVDNVTIGENAKTENLAKVFGIEGATSLDGSGFSSDNVGIEFGTPENGKVKLKAMPKDKSAKSFFMRVKVK